MLMHTRAVLVSKSYIAQRVSEANITDAAYWAVTRNSFRQYLIDSTLSTVPSRQYFIDSTFILSDVYSWCTLIPATEANKSTCCSQVFISYCS
jgi:hypothetical protein